MRSVNSDDNVWSVLHHALIMRNLPFCFHFHVEATYPVAYDSKYRSMSVQVSEVPIIKKKIHQPLNMYENENETKKYALTKLTFSSSWLRFRHGVRCQSTICRTWITINNGDASWEIICAEPRSGWCDLQLHGTVKLTVETKMYLKPTCRA